MDRLTLLGHQYLLECTGVVDGTVGLPLQLHVPEGQKAGDQGLCLDTTGLAVVRQVWQTSYQQCQCQWV